MRLARFLALGMVLLTTVWAHPMGNFSVNHYSRVALRAGGADVTFVLDLAEFPTFEMLRQWNMDADTPREQIRRKVDAQARDWVRHLRITSAGKPMSPHVNSVDMVMQPGAGSMPVMRVTSHLTVPAEPGALEYDDPTYAERTGWKEIVVAAGPGTSVTQTSVPLGQDRSQALTAYPTDPTMSPSTDTKVSLTWTGPAVIPPPPPVVAIQQKTPPPQPAPMVTAPVIHAPTAPANQQPATSPTLARQQQAPGTVNAGDYLSELLGRKDLSLLLILGGLAVSFGFGALHALSPGHGKTLVAAYLVGTRGTAKHALLLGAMVTFTHTISVFALGLATMFLSKYFLPEKIYPILGAISGLSIVLLGALMLYKRAKVLAKPAPVDWTYLNHHHHDGISHTHAFGGEHEHRHEQDGLMHSHEDGKVHSHVPEGPVTIGSLIALGASGGLVPCPSAMILLLSAISLGRIGFGLLLLISFSAGLAVVLTTIGVLVVYAKHLLPDRSRTSQNPVFRLVPVLSAAVVTVIGMVMTGVSLGWIKPVGFLS